MFGEVIIMKVTMKDIARKCDVSINAVSIALNDKNGLSNEMRFRILRTADEMGYINTKRKYLSSLSKTNICVLMQSYYADTGHFYSIVLKSIVEQAKSVGYFTLLNYFNDKEFVIPECITDRKVAGILVVGKISDKNLIYLNFHSSFNRACHILLIHHLLDYNFACMSIIQLKNKK